jgi:hypothetical protein
MYSILKHYIETGTVVDDHWTDTKSTGRKPVLRESTINLLIAQYNKVTNGGAAKSKTTLAESINTLCC